MRNICPLQHNNGEIMDSYPEQKWHNDPDIEIVDLPLEETRSIASAHVDLSLRLFARAWSLSRSWRKRHLFSPLTLLLLLIFASIAGSAPYEQALSPFNGTQTTLTGTKETVVVAN